MINSSTNEDNSKSYQPSDGHNKDASDAALEYVKQVLTLASAVLVVSAVFISRVSTRGLFGEILLIVAWALLLVSLAAGLIFITSIVASRKNNDNRWSDPGPRMVASTSLFSFVAAIVLFIVFAFSAYSSLNRTTEPLPNEGASVTLVLGAGQRFSVEKTVDTIHIETRGEVLVQVHRESTRKDVTPPIEEPDSSDNHDDPLPEQQQTQ